MSAEEPTLAAEAALDYISSSCYRISLLLASMQVFGLSDLLILNF